MPQLLDVSIDCFCFYPGFIDADSDLDADLTQPKGGSGSGTGDITGTGTVWPAQFKGLVSFVTSGTLRNVTGSFSGCGTVVSLSGFVGGNYPFKSTNP